MSRLPYWGVLSGREIHAWSSQVDGRRWNGPGLAEENRLGHFDLTQVNQEEFLRIEERLKSSS